MANGIMAYRIDRNLLDQYYGLQDENSIQAILLECQERLESLDQNFPPRDGWILAKDLLEQFLIGYWMLPVEQSKKHWFVLELLVAGLGRALPNGTWYPCAVQKWRSYEVFKPFFVSPTERFTLAPPKELPWVFTIEFQDLEVAEQLVLAENRDYFQAEEFKIWIQEAKLSTQDLILFYY